MGLDPTLLAELRENLRRSREADHEAWERSSRLVGRSHRDGTVQQLIQAVRSSSYPPALRKSLLTCLQEAPVSHPQAVAGEGLRHLTGLPQHKALRALCVLFGIGTKSSKPAPVSSLTPAKIEDWVRHCRNPFDLLLEAEVASLLDLGAGDLSFALEVTEQYLPMIREQHKELVLHAIDRVKPGSSLGALLHADPASLDRLRQPTPALQFRFWADHDMFDLQGAKGLWPCYTVAACHAPATPTFAYEPSRISKSLIEDHVRNTKGDFRKVRVHGEEALEVHHGGRALIFPPWKFEIRGPLALLDLMSRRGKLCVLAAVDTEVFWEIVSQLVNDERMRPRDVLFTPTTLPDVFGKLYAELSHLPVGDSVELSQVTDLRQQFPRVLREPGETQPSFFRFRSVRLSRGAVFQGIPASRTARLFKDMSEEAPPWFLVLVPEEQ